MEGRIYDKLCAIDDISRADALSHEATVFCAQCGAEAYDSSAVCKPESISLRRGRK